MPASHSVEQKKIVTVVYGSAAQPTSVIAERLAAGFQERGFVTELCLLRRAAKLDLRRFAAAVLIAPIPLGRDERDLVEFVRAQKDSLEHMPVAFLSMSVAGAGGSESEGARPKGVQFVADTRSVLDRLFVETGWRPKRHWPVSGAITYVRYNFVVRLILKLLSAGDVMQSSRRDDWRVLNTFLDDFEREIRAAEPGPASDL